MRAAFLIVLLACGGTETDETTPSIPTPEIEGWPTLPFHPAGIGLRALLDMTRELEPLPTATNMAWVAEVHAPWIEARAEVLANANEARRILRGGPQRELGVGAALHGHILLRTADQLEDANLGALPPDAAAAVRAPVFDLRQRASAAFGVCVEHIQTAELDGWRDGCRTRMRSLSLRLESPP